MKRPSRAIFAPSLVIIVLLVGRSAAHAQPSPRSATVPLDFLRALTLANGTAGDEEEVRAVLRDWLHGAASLSQTAKGDLVARLDGTSPEPLVLVTAHMDEVGFQVRAITSGGFLRLAPLGLWYGGSIVDHPVCVTTRKGRLRGVVGLKPPHLMSSAEKARAPGIPDLYVDIGASSAEEAIRWGVAPGDRVTPEGQFLSLSNPKRLLSKAWDDRAGCAIVAELVRALASTPHPNSVVAAWTSAEETGRSNATVKLPGLTPDFVIVVEVGLTRDTPDAEIQAHQETLGGGAVLDLYDGSIATPPAIRNWILDQAAAAAIPVQPTTILTEGAGVSHQNSSFLFRAPSTALLLPLRYAHAPLGMIDANDYQRTRDLLLRLLVSLDAATIRRLRGLR
jgi:putative aminopeptidase FrvX